MLKKLFLAFFLVFTLIACDNSSTVITVEPTTSITYHSITLTNEYTESTREFESIAYGEMLNLPVDEIEGKVFVGWSDGETVYNNSLIVETSLNLEAVYEDASEVFVYYSNPYTDLIVIKGYTGNSKYLRIPEVIEGYNVIGIASEAFKSTDIVEVELPNSLVRIFSRAFVDAPNLEKVSFYGDYSGTREVSISDQEYVSILEEFSDVCQVTETTETGWKFAEGCPIKEVLEVREFTSYKVIFDLAINDDHPYTLMIELGAFDNLPKLKTVVFPERYGFFYGDIFDNTPNLINLDFTDNIYFYTENNVVYKRVYSNFNPEDVKYQLSFYPPGLTSKEFTVPDQVSSIGIAAFYDNNHLEVINLSKNIETINSKVFTYVYNLKEINVDAENEYWYSIDGVLYSGDFLICYPRAKTDKVYIMPEDISIIAPLAFFGQKYLVNIAFNDGLLRIEYEAFTQTEKIKVLNIPNSVVFIDALYYQESSLETVIINRSIVTDETITNIKVPRANDLPRFYVPDDSYDDYIADPDWAEMIYNIQPLSELEIEG